MIYNAPGRFLMPSSSLSYCFWNCLEGNYSHFSVSLTPEYVYPWVLHLLFLADFFLHVIVLGTQIFDNIGTTHSYWLLKIVGTVELTKSVLEMWDLVR